MRKMPLRRAGILASALLLSGLFTSRSTCHAKVLDDFNDNTVSEWQKFDFGTGNGRLTEATGQFTVDMIAPPGQPFFVAATKTSQTFLVKDGRTVEFRVDLVNANQPDAFAVLAWIPTTSSVASLQGYSISKDEGDILIAKGLNQYFVDFTGPVRNDNVTMVLRLTGAGTSVIITGRVLDRANNNAVLWEQTFTDTIGADPVSNESPLASYIGQSGNFVLLTYHNDDPGGSMPPSVVTYDNAEYEVTEKLLLDNFNDNVVTDWQKFDFGSGIGRLTEANGQFTVDTLVPPGQPFFVAATKTSPTFQLRDGEFLEFRVDLVSANQPDAFAVMGWLPGSVASLQGYSIAKDEGDILIAKGLNQYFVDFTGPVRNDNVTLALKLTGTGTSVIINGRVLDPANTNAVLWEGTFTDTAGPDPVSNENPLTSYVGQSGNFVLLTYHNDDPGGTMPPSVVTYDNAEVTFVPSEINPPPIIANVQPNNGAAFQSATTLLTFTASDDKAIPTNQISITLNGTVFTATNGLSVSGPGTNRTVSLGGLSTNLNYTARLQVVDADGATNSTLLYLDTFLESNFTIESEDYDFNGGAFIDNPVVTAEGSGVQANAYRDQAGVPDIDFRDQDGAPNPTDNTYRLPDRVDTGRVVPADQRQKFVAAGGSALGYYDYAISELHAGEFLNYTRTFPAGSYEIYLRQAVFTLTQSEAILERVVSGTGTTNQQTQVLGSFLGFKSGVEYRSIPLTDGAGINKLILRLSGQQTLRLRQNNAADLVLQNYLIFIPVPDPGLQRATVTSVSPAPNSTVNSVEPVLGATIENRDTSVTLTSVVFRVNGGVVPATVTPTANGVTVSYSLSPLSAPGSLVTARLVFSDNFNVAQTNDWSFTVSYNRLLAANRASGPGGQRGFAVRLVQSPADSDFDNSLTVAEQQLAVPPGVPIEFSTNTSAPAINFTDEILPFSSPYFPYDANFPGIDPQIQPSPDYVAIEALAYLDLPAGAHRFGVRSDDGFKLQSGTSLTDTNGLVLGLRTDGTFDGTFEFVAEAAGLYPFRFVYYETRGDAYVQLFSVNRTTGDRILINDASNPGAIKAYQTISAPSVVLESAAALGTGGFSPETSAIIDTVSRSITVPQSGGQRFYRLSSATALTIQSIQLSGGNVILNYQ